MVIKLDVAVPDTLDSLEPIELIDRMSSLRAAFVERYAIAALKRSYWDKDTKGFYVLLSHINADNTFTAYVGQTDYSFERRLREHDKTKDYWNLAVLFKRDHEVPFNRSETRFLEGAMVDALKSSPNVSVTNEKATGEDALSDWEKPYMEQILLSALRVLFLRGYRNSHLGAITRKLETDTAKRAEKPQIENQPVPRREPPKVPVSRVYSTSVLGSDKEDMYAAVERIGQEIHEKILEEKGKDKFYSSWAKAKTIADIVDARPQSAQELKAIHNVGANFLSRTEDIIQLFKNDT
jgi:hypothetical protein